MKIMAKDSAFCFSSSLSTVQQVKKFSPEIAVVGPCMERLQFSLIYNGGFPSITLGNKQGFPAERAILGEAGILAANQARTLNISLFDHGTIVREPWWLVNSFSDWLTVIETVTEPVCCCHYRKQLGIPMTLKEVIMQHSYAASRVIPVTGATILMTANDNRVGFLLISPSTAPIYIWLDNSSVPQLKIDDDGSGAAGAMGTGVYPLDLNLFEDGQQVQRQWVGVSLGELTWLTVIEIMAPPRCEWPRLYREACAA